MRIQEVCTVILCIGGTFQANRHIISTENIENIIIRFSSDHAVTHIDCRFNDCSLLWYTLCGITSSMQNHIYMPEEMIFNMLSSESLQ